MNKTLREFTTQNNKSLSNTTMEVLSFSVAYALKNGWYKK